MNDQDLENVAALSFTLGPWRVDDRRSAPLPNILIRGADNSHVAQAEGVHMRDKMLRWSPQDADRADRRAMSNARRIAAPCSPIGLCGVLSEVEPDERNRCKQRS